MSLFETLRVSSALLFFTFTDISEAARCRPRNPSIAFSPAQVSAEVGKAAVVSINIRNNDIGCRATTFTLTDSHSSAISAVLNASQIRLSSGSSGTVQMTVSSSVVSSHIIQVGLSDIDGVSPAHFTVSAALTANIAEAPTQTPSYQLTLSSPASGATVSGSVNIQGTGPGFQNVEIFSSTGVMLGRGTPSSTGAFSISIDTTQLSEGLQTLSIYAWDAPAGQAFTHSDQESLTLNVKNIIIIPPSYNITLTSPASGSSVSGIVTIKGSAPGMLNVEIFNSAGVMLTRVTPDSSGAFSANIDTTKLVNGSQTLTIMAWDSPAGQAFTHTDTETLSLNVQNNVVVPVPVYTDGTARLNNLLNQSLNVVIPSGVYMITGELNVRDGHMISAASGAQVTLKVAGSYSGRIMTLYDERITVRGITFDGNYSQRLSLEGQVDASLITVSGGSFVTFENNKFQYAPSFGIWAYRSSQIQIKGNTFLECYHAIRLDAANLEAGVIESNTFKNTAAFKSIQHIEAIYTRNLVVRGNTMEGAGLQEPTSHGYEGTWGNSIYIFNSTGHLVEYNKVYRNYWSALVSGADATHGIIRHNYFQAAGPITGIAVWIEQFGAEYITFDNNELDGGLFVGDNGGDHLVITNNIIRSRTVGIDVSFAAKDVLIQGNKIYSAAGTRHENGIYLWEKKTPDVNVRVYNNHFEGFNNGIAINNYGGVGIVYGITLSGNTFSNNNVNIWVPSGITLNQPLGQ